MTTNGSRLAACAVALSLAACTPEKADFSLTTDAAPGDARRDREMGGARLDAHAEAHADARGATNVDAGPPCLLGGKTETDPATVGCTQSALGRIVVAGDHVYWTVRGGGAVVLRAPLSNGAPEALVYDGAAAFGLAVDASFAYYSQPAVGRIMRVPIGGGPPVALVTGLASPNVIALDSASDGVSLYWTGGPAMGPAIGQGVVMKLALANGAAPVTLIDGQTSPFALAVQDGFVYWTDFVDGTILRTSTAGPSDAGVRLASRLATGLRGPSDLALANGFAYAPDLSGHIRRVPLAGGPLEPVADVAGEMPFGVATDGLSLYWSTLGDGGAIYKVRLPSSAPITTPLTTPTTLKPYLANQPNPGPLAVGPTNIYWSTNGGRPTIWRFAK